MNNETNGEQVAAAGERVDATAADKCPIGLDDNWQVCSAGTCAKCRTARAAASPADAPAEPTDAEKAINLLDTLFAAYEEGPDVYEDPDECAGHLGHAVKLDDATFQACIDVLNRLRPRETAASPADAPADLTHLNYVWNTLMFFASESSYTLGERTGGVLAGCPRKPPPTPAEMACYARWALASLCRHLGKEPDEWMTADAPQPAKAAPTLLEACQKAEEWLSGWASAEPYLSVIRAAIANATDPQPARGHRELMLLAAADLESWMKSYNRDAATEDLVARLREAAMPAAVLPDGEPPKAAGVKGPDHG